MGAETLNETGAAGAFRHEALLYAGEEAFLEATVSFIADGLAQHEPVMVAVSARKISLLRANLGWDGQWVDFVDMAQLGTNPGRIISAWRQFVHDHLDHPHLRGIGEPMWADRRPAERLECQHHELLLNAAFAPERPWRLLCPYDTATLDPEVIVEAERTHPFVQHGGSGEVSAVFRADEDALAATLGAPLPEPQARWRERSFDAMSRSEVRLLIMDTVPVVSRTRASDLVRAVDEVIDNSIRHGGGGGTVRVWHDGAGVVCEVRDVGHLVDPLAGRGLPPADRGQGRGLWLAHELCDLVQVRSSPQGTVVRMTMHAGGR